MEWMTLLLMVLVNGLLLYASARLFGSSAKPLRVVMAAVLGTFLAGGSMLPGIAFLDSFWWRGICLVVMGLTAFGFSERLVSKLLLFIVLHLSLGGVAATKAGVGSMLLGAAGIGFACIAAGSGETMVPVELSYGGKQVKITALRDTGNTLMDPVTGNSVLVVDAQVARELAGLSAEALQNPLETLGTMPGLRLIPYRTVGNSGFLLALRIPQVKIGSWQGSRLVAFSPEIMGRTYQALTGGMI